MSEDKTVDSIIEQMEKTLGDAEARREKIMEVLEDLSTTGYIRLLENGKILVSPKIVPDTMIAMVDLVSHGLEANPEAVSEDLEKMEPDVLIQTSMLMLLLDSIVEMRVKAKIPPEKAVSFKADYIGAVALVASAIFDIIKSTDKKAYKLLVATAKYIIETAKLASKTDR